MLGELLLVSDHQIGAAKEVGISIASPLPVLWVMFAVVSWKGWVGAKGMGPHRKGPLGLQRIWLWKWPVRRSSWDRWMRNYSVVPDVKWTLFISGGLRLPRDTTPTQERPKRSSLMKIEIEQPFLVLDSLPAPKPIFFQTQLFFLLFKFKLVYFCFQANFSLSCWVESSVLGSVTLFPPSEQRGSPFCSPSGTGSASLPC